MSRYCSSLGITLGDATEDDLIKLGCQGDDRFPINGELPLEGEETSKQRTTSEQDVVVIEGSIVVSF